MNRAQLQHLTHERILDAQALLDGGRWSFAYYNVGYAVECALKACFLARMPITGWVFEDKVKIESCRTHDFGDLIIIAGLRAELNAILASNGTFAKNWEEVRGWKVESRYSTIYGEVDARRLYAAITDAPDGVLPWIMSFW